MKSTKDNLIMFTKPYSGEIKEIKKYHVVKRNVITKRNSLLLNMSLYIAFSVFITFVLAYTAFLERGYFAMGGEYIFLILLPIGICKILEFNQKQQKSTYVPHHKAKNFTYYKVS